MYAGTWNGMRAGVVLGLALACSSSEPKEDDGDGLGSQTPLFGDGDLMGPDFGTDPDDPNGGGSEGCVGQTAGTEAVPAVLQLVVDTSGSMDQDAPGSRDSKWVITRQALLGAIDEMPANTSLGVVFYPDVPITADTCFDNQADVP